MVETEFEVGTQLPFLAVAPITRTDLALFAGASGDHNAIHIDIDYARRAGMVDVFGQGMLSMAWVARCITQTIRQAQIRSLNARFLGIAHLGNAMTCTAHVVEIFEDDGERRAKIALLLSNQYGDSKVAAEAVVALAEKDEKHG